MKFSIWNLSLVYTATGHAPDNLRKAKSKDDPFHEKDDRLFYLLTHYLKLAEHFE